MYDSGLEVVEILSKPWIVGSELHHEIKQYVQSLARGHSEVGFHLIKHIGKIVFEARPNVFQDVWGMIGALYPVEVSDSPNVPNGGGEPFACFNVENVDGCTPPFFLVKALKAT